MVHMSRPPGYWTVLRHILLIHGLSHGLENANENAQINPGNVKIFFWFYYEIPCNSYLIASTH